MGGREELFGIWLDYDFGKGTVAPTCTTFRSPQLTPNQEIEIKALEVWALGPEEEDSDEEVGASLIKNVSTLFDIFHPTLGMRLAHLNQSNGVFLP